MYFGTDVQQRILANFYFALNRGGFLVVGKAEALQSGRRLFKAHDLKRRIFVRDGAAEPGFMHIARLPAVGAELDRPGLDQLRDAAFEHAPIAALVVDDENQVIAINQPARAMFGLKLKDVGRPLQDLDISYRPVELRSLIDEAREKRRLVQMKDVHWQLAGGDERSLEVQVSPLVATGERVVGISVAFIDVTIHRALEEHLDSARRELETAYEELQSTVEELETTNEELQSTNEELETTNEELQSTNEELETMNEELQSTNEELETINDELQQRTDELNDVNSFLEAVLGSLAAAVVVVDREMRITAWNDAARNLWGLHSHEVQGEHLLNLDIGLPVDKLRAPIRNVLAGKGPELLELAAVNRRGKQTNVVLRFAPLASNGDDVRGAIVMMEASDG
jgi:two-component system CheB/CheR fusion protein